MGLFGPSKAIIIEVSMKELLGHVDRSYMKLTMGENGVQIYASNDYEISYKKGIHIRNSNYKVDFDERIASKIKAIVVTRNGRKTIAYYSYEVINTPKDNNVIVGNGISGKDGQPGKAILNQENSNNHNLESTKMDNDRTTYNGLPVISLDEVKNRGGRQFMNVGVFTLYAISGGLNIGNMNSNGDVFAVTINGVELKGSPNDGIVGVFVDGRKLYYVTNRKTKSSGKKDQESEPQIGTITMEKVISAGCYYCVSYMNGYSIYTSNNNGLSISSNHINGKDTFKINKTVIDVPYGMRFKGLLYDNGKVYYIV